MSGCLNSAGNSVSSNVERDISQLQVEPQASLLKKMLQVDWHMLNQVLLKGLNQHVQGAPEIPENILKARVHTVHLKQK